MNQSSILGKSSGSNFQQHGHIVSKNNKKSQICLFLGIKYNNSCFQNFNDFPFLFLNMKQAKQFLINNNTAKGHRFDHLTTTKLAPNSVSGLSRTK